MRTVPRCPRPRLIGLVAVALLVSVSASAQDPLPLFATTGHFRVGVVLVHFQNDLRQPFTLAQMVSNLNAAGVKVATQSYGRATWAPVVGFEWTTIPLDVPLTTSDCNLLLIRVQQLAGAARPEATWPAFDKVFYIVPAADRCGINGATVYGGQYVLLVGGTTAAVHEFGHTVLLAHAHSSPCLGTVCSSVDRGNDVSGMGIGPGMWDALQKTAISWLGTPETAPVLTVAPGDHYVEAYASSVTGQPKALRVLNGETAGQGFAWRDWTYVEYRWPVAGSLDASVSSGVRLERGIPKEPNVDASPVHSAQQDTDPLTSAYVPQLGVGQSIVVGAFRYTTLFADPIGASVRIERVGMSAPQPPGIALVE